MRNIIAKNLKLITLVNRIQFFLIIILLGFIPLFLQERYYNGELIESKSVFFFFDRGDEFSTSFLAIIFVCFLLLTLVFKYKNMIFEILVTTLLMTMIIVPIMYKISDSHFYANIVRLRVGYFLLLFSVLVNLATYIFNTKLSEQKTAMPIDKEKATNSSKTKLIRHMLAMYLFSAFPIMIRYKDLQNIARVGLFFFAESSGHFDISFIPSLGESFFLSLRSNLDGSIGMNMWLINEIIIVLMIFLLLLERWKFNFKNVKINIKYIFGVLVILFVIFAAIFHSYVASGNLSFLYSLIAPMLLYLLCPWILLPYFLMMTDEKEQSMMKLGFGFFLLQNIITTIAFNLGTSTILEFREFYTGPRYTAQFTLNVLVLPFIATKIFLNRKREKESLSIEEG
ncbi:MAG: hypothetical protein KGD64_11345 [Candidatus Heimdallarchaeota archaeon]|nr:hypothetical protein [Candidatus Heimdallarchaeota archaeon]